MIMPKRNKPDDDSKQKLQQAVGLLKFVLTLDDAEITQSTIESVIELLEEEISKWIQPITTLFVSYGDTYQ